MTTAAIRKESRWGALITVLQRHGGVFNRA